jgi:uncharacterized protein YcfL
MKTRPLLLAALVLAPALLLPSGCTTVNSVEPAQPMAQRQMISDKRVITDSTLNRHVNIIGVNAATTPAGFLKIQLELQNTSSRPYSFTYRVEWFDENAMIISLPTDAAMPRTIEGKETLSITAIAPTDKAKDFRIKLLESTN